MLVFGITIYALAIVTANLLVARFGPGVTPINAFVLIGLDLALRNWLSLRMDAKRMALLIVSTGLLSYAINPATGMIAIASGLAFTLAALTDWLAFNTVAGSWFKRNLAGNSAGALVDSVVFPSLAFGALMPGIIALQFVAKVLGGSLWGLVIQRLTNFEAHDADASDVKT